MAYASRAGRARTSARSPAAHAICMRCGFRYNRVDLKFQHDWRGTSLQNLNILVCDDCYDTPQNQLRALQIAADPVPVYFPSVQDFQAASEDIRTTQGNSVDPITGIPIPGGDTRITQGDDTRTTQQTGEAPNGLNIIPGAELTQIDFGAPRLPYGMNVIPETGFLPGVSYVLWNNTTYSPINWYNSGKNVVTWIVS